MQEVLDQVYGTEDSHLDSVVVRLQNRTMYTETW